MIETLIASSALILGICLLRRLLKGRIAPQVQYSLWGIAAVRLMLPWFEWIFGWSGRISSRFSVMNGAAAFGRRLQDSGRLSSQAELPWGGLEYRALRLAGKLGEGGGGPLPLAGEAAKDGAGIAGASALWETGLQPAYHILWWIWLIGGLLLMSWMLAANIRFFRKLARDRLPYEGDTFGLTRLPVYVVPKLSTPCFTGYGRRRAIYLTGQLAEAAALHPDAVRHVLAHEECHGRHRDSLWGALRCLLLCFYWFHPLVWAAAFLSKQDCEMACDASAIKLLGEAERFSYGRTLIHLAEARYFAGGLFCVSPDLGNGKKAMKERIWAVARHPRMTAAVCAVIGLALAGLILCTYTGQVSGEVPAERVSQWADAFCRRDGAALKDLYQPERLDRFYEIDMVSAQPGDPFVGFGWSSPWPMDGQYSIQIRETEAEIIYYAMTSDPHRYVWKEWLTWERTGDTWYVAEERCQDYDSIQSADAFYQAYREGIAGTPMDYQAQEAGLVLNEQAKEQRSSAAYADLFTPQWAMEKLLNLHGGTALAISAPEGVEGEKKGLNEGGDGNGQRGGAGGRMIAVYTFPDDSQAAVWMEQPYGEDGIWVPGEIVIDPEAFLEEGAAEEKEPAGAFFDTHKMSDYLTYRLPDGLSNGLFSQNIGDGGNLFLTSDSEAQARLEELSRYVDRDFVPEEWYGAGYAARYTGSFPERSFGKGSLLEVHYPWNHSSSLSEPVSVADCEAPALLMLIEHDLTTAGMLEALEKQYGTIPEENRTSDMWYVFFARPDCQEMYSIALNADLYSRDQILKTARSVHFTERAWTKP